MNMKTFELRLQSLYQGPENGIRRMAVQLRRGVSWDPFEINNLSPGFEIYCYAMLTCQHTFFRLNCAERGLLLSRTDGEVTLVTDEDWHLQSVAARMQASLQSGQPNDDDVAYIQSRMLACPVSKNLPEGVDAKAEVLFV